jgi:hypothetical protein
MDPIYIGERTKTRVLIGNAYKNLETEYKEFLENNTGSEILDLQFSIASSGGGGTIANLLITFKEKSPKKEDGNILGDL